MRVKRFWKLGILMVVTAFTIAACTGGQAPTPTPLPKPVAGPTAPPAATSPGAGTVASASPTASAPAAEAPKSGTGQTRPTSAGAAAAVSSFSWEVSTVDDNGAKPSLALDPRGVPHIAFILEAMPGFVKHGVLGDGGWDISTVSSGYFYGPLDIKVDQQGVPKISWHNHDAEDQAFAELVDGKWVVQDIKHPGHDGWDGNLALDSKGRPHTVSIDPKQFGSDSGVEYATLDGTAWTVEEVGSGPIAYEFGTGIAVDSQDRPHVVWFDDSAKDLKYAFKDGDSWKTSTVDSEGDVGRYPFLALDKQDNAIISYFERISDTTGYIKVARWDGNAWESQRVDKLENVSAGFFGARKTSSLVLDGDDSPILAYSDEKVIKIARQEGSQWKIETVLDGGDPPLGQQVSLALDGDGVLHLTFADVTSKGSPGVKGSIKYARGTPNAAATPEPTVGVSDTGGSAPAQEPAATAAPKPVVVVQPDPDFLDKMRAAGLSSAGWTTDFSRHTVPFASILSGGPPRDGIPPIDDPKFTTFEESDEYIDPLEPVVFFSLNGDARAYPLQILTWHEIVNDVVGGVPVAVTFCPLCNSAIVFDRRLDGVVHTFGTSGKVRNSDLVMWDRQTETWWQQLTGEGIIGQLAGRRLTFMPASIISWEDFKAANPNGKVLSRDTGNVRRYGQNPYVGYDRVDNPPFLFRGETDGRLLPMERVVTVTVGDDAAAFPFSILVKERVVNYTVGGRDLVVFFKPGTRSALGDAFIGSAEKIGAAVLFDAKLDGRKLTFQSRDDRFIDNETGSTWSILGEATEGELAGKRLTPVAHTNSFWFAVAAFNPDTKIYQGAG
ncbi:MAG: DUF3179 domain-containing protein [Chloroflexi bacterium]|nr:DUF3179 domain-containing protein [Chloroflexota bacterium]